MPLNRRELLQATGSAVIGAASTADRLGAAQAATGDEFSIENVFADFMRDIGGSAEDPGGRVLFTGRDPILQSHFRLGACMAIPAMAGGVGAAAVWRERTGWRRNSASTCAKPCTALRRGRASSPTTTSPRARCRQAGCLRNGIGTRRSTAGISRCHSSWATALDQKGRLWIKKIKSFFEDRCTSCSLQYARPSQQSRRWSWWLRSWYRPQLARQRTTIHRRCWHAAGGFPLPSFLPTLRPTKNRAPSVRFTATSTIRQHPRPPLPAPRIRRPKISLI